MSMADLGLSSLSLTSSVSLSSIDDNAPIPEFVDEVDPTYLCAQCHQVVRQSCQTTCGHRICQRCVDHLRTVHASEVFRCPAGEEDCEDMTVDQIRPDFSGRRHLLLLRTYCLNKQFGCTEIKQWRKLQDHINHECKFNTTSCPNDCGATDIVRLKLNDHLSACVRQRKSCTYQRFGCQFQDTESELQKHYVNDTSAHLELVVVRVAQLELKNTELEGRCDELTASLESAKTKCNELAASNESLSKQVVVMSSRITDFEKSTRTAMDGQSGGIAKLEQEHTQMRIEFQREVIAVKEKFGRLERQVQSTPESGGGSRRTQPPSAALPEEFRLQMISHDKTIGVHDVRLAELDLRLQCMETTNYDGCLIWKITEYSRRKRDAANGTTLSLYSQPFYTSRYGYKLCARVYLNGDGSGRGTHVSFFLVVMQGDYDELLTWPFSQRVTLCLLDQQQRRKDLADTFRPDPSSSSFQKPKTPMNIASGCPLFVRHSVLEASDSPYLINDTLYLKIQVDISDLLNP